MKFGLALGGGGARGFAHIGVLEVLEKEKVPIDFVSGTSMGAVVGALYAKDKDLNYVKEKIYSSIEKKVLKDLEEEYARLEDKTTITNPKLKKALLFVHELVFWNARVIERCLVDLQPFESLFQELFGKARFSVCKIPFLCVATDLVSRQVVYLQDGLISEALTATIALPGIFPPIKYDKKFLIDGGVLESIPSEALKQEGMDFITAISLEKKRKSSRLKTSMDIIMATNEIRHKKLVEYNLACADFVFEPDTAAYGWADFSKIDEIIDKGRKEAESKISLLKNKLKRKRFWPFSWIKR